MLLSAADVIALRRNYGTRVVCHVNLIPLKMESYEPKPFALLAFSFARGDAWRYCGGTIRDAPTGDQNRKRSRFGAAGAC